MKFTLNSLNNFIELKQFFNTPDVLSDKLSSCGFEVAEWEEKKFQHLVVVEIKRKNPHPSADRLTVCQVESEKSRLYSIVCGADNFVEGDKAVLALPGAILPGGFKIKTRTIRGETSEGMLVSLSELGLAGEPVSREDATQSDQHFLPQNEGILILPKDIKAGTDFASYAGLNDIIFDIDITPNRADCLSHFGLSRELSCILNQPFKPDFLSHFGFKEQGKPAFYSREGMGELLSAPLEVNFPFTGPDIKNRLGLRVKQTGLCVRYTGRAVYGVKVQPSPLWLKVSLQNMGFKSINNIVDLTNYLLIQWGQPLHAFDLDRLKKEIIVDFSRKGEKLRTLGNQEIDLTGEELCIRDADQPLALAGVIGGEDSGISSDTKNVFLESACFTSSQVRKTSKRFNIETDSSYRFSRGVPPKAVLNVLRILAVMTQKLAGGQVSGDEYDLHEKSLKIKPIEIKKEHLERRLGMEVSSAKFQDWMKRLGCRIQDEEGPKGPKKGKQSEEKTTVFPPYFRFDLNIKEDLIEEYARLEGYDKIPEKISYPSDFPKADQKEYTLSSKIICILAHEGFYQAINHSFISRKFSDSFLGVEAGKNSFSNGIEKHSESFLWPSVEKKNLSPVLITNPLSAEYNMMRISLAPSLFKNAKQSIRHGCLNGRLFELGKVFASAQFAEEAIQTSLAETSTRRALVEQNKKKSYVEEQRLGFIAWGQEESLWEKPENRLCVYDLKTALNALLEQLYIFDYRWEQASSAPGFIHPYQYMVLKVQNKPVAYVGSLNPIYAENHKIRIDMALAELNTCFLFDKDFVKPVFQKLSSFPLVERDLSFLIPNNFPAGSMIEGIKRLAGPICRKVKIFDIYENEQTRRKGLRSVAFRLTLQSDKETLTEDRLTKLQKKLTKELTNLHPVKLR